MTISISGSNSGNAWTAAQIDILKSGVANGLTFSTIARELGVTRNAVIGKAHRLGLSAQKLNRGWAGAHKPKPKGKRMPRTGELGTELVYPFREAETQARGAGLDGSVQVSITEPAPTGGMTLLELRSHHCRWPLWPPLAMVDRFCGAAVEPGYPYCLDHGCQAYLGPRWARVAAELAARIAAGCPTTVPRTVPTA